MFSFSVSLPFSLSFWDVLSVLLFLFQSLSLWTLNSNGTCKRHFAVQVRFRYSSVLLILDDDVLDSWDLCLFIWLSWAFCYWAGSRVYIMIRSVLPNAWPLINFVNHLFKCKWFWLSRSALTECWVSRCRTVLKSTKSND